MKTVYIPTGTEVSHMNLATGHLVVDGSLTITGTLKAKTIGGRASWRRALCPPTASGWMI